MLDGSSFRDHYNYLVFKYIIQVYLRKNTIRIIMARIYNFFHSLNVIDKIIIVFTHSWSVPMVTEFIK